MSAPRLYHDERTGRYYVRIQATGIRRRFWLGTSKKRAANALKKLVKQMAAGVVTFARTESTATTAPDGTPDLRIEELAHKHLAWVQQNRAPATYKLRKRSAKLFIDFMGPSMVSAITKVKLCEFQDFVRTHHGRGGNRGNSYLRDVKTMFRWAEDMEICPCPVRKFPAMTYTPPQTKRFTDDEGKKLLGRIPEGDFKDLVVFGLMTGLRPKEIRELKREHVLPDCRNPEYLRIEQHKTAKMQHEPRPRTVPLSSSASLIVATQLAKHPDSPCVFLNDDGTPYDRDVLRRKLERWCRRAKIPVRAPYALRHTFASVEAENGVDAVTLAQLMGHTDISTTARYVATTHDHQRKLNEMASRHVARLLEEAAAEAETGQKVATKVATNGSTDSAETKPAGVTCATPAGKDGRGDEI